MSSIEFGYLPDSLYNEGLSENVSSIEITLQ